MVSADMKGQYITFRKQLDLYDSLLSLFLHKHIKNRDNLGNRLTRSIKSIVLSTIRKRPNPRTYWVLPASDELDQE